MMNLEDKPDNLSKKMENTIDQIWEKLNEIFFDGESQEITFEALNRKFTNDQWFLTSGYIREVVLNLLKKIEVL